MMSYIPADNQLQPQNNKNSNNNKGHHHQQHSGHYGNRSHHQLDRKVSRAAAKYSDAVKRDDAQRKAERDAERDEEYRLAAVFRGKATVGDKLPCKLNENNKNAMSLGRLCDAEINVPLYLQEEPIVALVDSGKTYPTSKCWCYD
ncbi:hypothetical protein BC941DRAFT_457678 [Chlamydoabsidia padenii]|nr:hypothetical protein BC941DRAFT_457678 [Chlamydoabsidia padenii]